MESKAQRKIKEGMSKKDYFWANPETWSRDYWFIGDKTLTVYQDVQKLEEVDAKLSKQVKTALNAPACEILDI